MPMNIKRYGFLVQRGFLSVAAIACAARQAALTVSLIITVATLMPAATANAVEQFFEQFKALYVDPAGSDSEQVLAKMVSAVKCNVCHVGESKKNRNAYGEALSELLDKKNDKNNIDKIQAALIRVAGTEGPDGTTFGARLAAGRLPVDAEPAVANGDELEGRWKVVSMDGQTGGFQPGLQFVVRGERWEYVDADTNIKQKSGTLRVDSRARPKQLDLIATADIKAPNRAYAFWVSDGSPVRCLYDVQGDSLTITWRHPGTGQPRPAGMAGDGQFVIVHKRLRQ